MRIMDNLGLLVPKEWALAKCRGKWADDYKG